LIRGGSIGGSGEKRIKRDQRNPPEFIKEKLEKGPKRNPLRPVREWGGEKLSGENTGPHIRKKKERGGEVEKVRGTEELKNVSL